MDIERLRVFVSIADCHSFTKAAEQLYSSQPTLSRHIQDLEKILEVQLFDRTTRRVELTDAGKLFYREATQIIKTYDALMQRATLLGNGISGSLRVGYLELFTQNILPAAIREFRKKFPMVELQLYEETLNGSMQGLIEGRFDVSFLVTRENSVKNPELEYRRILSGELELVLSKFHPYSNYKIVSPEVLRNEDILTYDEAETPELRENIVQMCMQHGFMPRFRPGNYSPGGIFLLVQAGVGVSLLSSLMTSVLLSEDRFSTVKLEGTSFPTNLELVWRKDNDNPCIYNFLRETQEAAHPGTIETG